jgi:flagellin-like protein
MGHGPTRQRGQSETVGVILLLAVVLTLVVGAGAVLISDWYADTERDARVAVDSDLTATELTLRHMGGDTLDPADVRVVIREADQQLTLADPGFSGTANRFEAGSRWEYSFAQLPAEVTVQVFDTSTNTLLHEQGYDVR